MTRPLRSDEDGLSNLAFGAGTGRIHFSQRDHPGRPVRVDPKTGLSFIPARPLPVRKRGAHRNPLFCRFEIPNYRRFLKTGQNYRISGWAWTPFRVEPENPIPGLANGALYGSGWVQVRETLSSWLSSGNSTCILPDPPHNIY